MIGITKIATKLDFNPMANPFGIKILTEKQAIKIIKDNGFKFKRMTASRKTIAVIPLGDTYEFIEKLRDSKIYIINQGIGVK